MVTALAQNAVQLGYITFWFRERELARAVALFMTALPVSTWILENTGWFGIEGWRWLFVLGERHRFSSGS